MQGIYIFMTLVSLMMVSVIVWIGAYLSDRAGLPTISRMMEDCPDVMPFLWTSFALITCVVGVVASLSTGPRKRLKLLMTLLQFLAVMLVPLASLDYMYVLHMALAALVVALTLARDWVFFQGSDTALRVLHALVVLSIVVLGLVFVIVANVVPDAENETYIAITEYGLMKLVAAINIFYVGEITTATVPPEAFSAPRRANSCYTALPQEAKPGTL